MESGLAVPFRFLYTIFAFPYSGVILVSPRPQPAVPAPDDQSDASPTTQPLADGSAVEHMVPLVYEELRRIARRQLRNEAVGHTLNTTALVHEAYLRLAAPAHLDVSGRAEFLAIAAMAMRRVLIDYARQRTAQKRGGVQMRVELDDI